MRYLIVGDIQVFRASLKSLKEISSVLCFCVPNLLGLRKRTKTMFKTFFVILTFIVSINADCSHYQDCASCAAGKKKKIFRVFFFYNYYDDFCPPNLEIFALSNSNFIIHPY